jgi:hypothetical protein
MPVHDPVATALADVNRPRCGARSRRVISTGPADDPTMFVEVGPPCRNWPVKGRKRCKLHGGLSTGPVTSEGKARVVAAMVEGRRRWIDRMRAEGKRLPGGAKPGVTPPRVKARREAKAMLQEAERWVAMTPEQRLSEARERERTAALDRLDAIREHFDRTAELVGMTGSDAALFIKGQGWQADDADREGRRMVDRRPETRPERSVAPRQTVTRVAAQLVERNEDIHDGAVRLDDLVTLSLDKLREILTLPLPTEVLTSLEHKDFASALALAKTQLAATERVLATQVRVDETRLKRRQADVLPRLLEIIAEEKRLIAESKTIDTSPVEGPGADAHD